MNCLNLNSAVEIANARNIVIRKWLQHTSSTAPQLNLRRTAVFRLKGTRFDHFWAMGPKEKLKSGKQKVEIPMKTSRSPLLFPLFLYLARVFGLWPETLCREPGEPFSPAFIREDQSARRRLERPGWSRSPFFIESFRLGKENASSTGHGRSGTPVPRNLCAAVKLPKRIRPVLQTGLIVEK